MNPLAEFLQGGKLVLDGNLPGFYVVRLVPNFRGVRIPVTTPIKTYRTFKLFCFVWLSIENQGNCCFSVYISRTSNINAVNFWIGGVSQYDYVLFPNVRDCDKTIVLRAAG